MTTSELENQAPELSRQLSSSEVESLASELFDDALVPTHTSSWQPQSDSHRLDEEEEDREKEREAQNSGTSSTETENSDLSEKPEQSSNNMPHAGGPPAKHGLFSPKLREKRLAVVKKIGISILLMGTLMLTLFSIYWGSFYKRLSYLDRVHLWIVNNDDGDLIGSSFTTIAQSFATAKHTVNVETVDSLTYDDIVKLVQDEHTWGVFYIPANSTSTLETALANPSASEAAAYSGADSVRFLYSQARDQLAMGYIVTWVNELERNYTAEFAMQVLSLTTSSSDKYDLSTIVSDAPHLIARPSSIELENLFPFDNPTATATTQVGLIFIVITSFFQFNFFAPIHALISPELKRSHLIFYRYLSSWVAYFFLSLFYSLVSLAFQMDFTRTFGRAGFVIFWMTNYLGMLSVGIFLENLALICISTFPPILGFGLICTVISNISPAFYSIPLQHRFYRYGYALPIKNLADATRTIMFNTHNTMGRNYGVLVAWIAIDMIMLPFSLNFFGKTMMKRKMAEMKAQAKK